MVAKVKIGDSPEALRQKLNAAIDALAVIESYFSGGDLNVANITADHITAEVTTDNLNVSVGTPPASPTSTGTVGTVILTQNFIYFCYATNLWHRGALMTWV